MRSKIGWYTIPTCAITSDANVIHKALTPRAIEALQCSEATAPTFPDHDGWNLTSQTGRAWVMRFQAIYVPISCSLLWKVFALFHLWCFGGVLSTRNQASKPADVKIKCIAGFDLLQLSSSHLLLERFSSCRSCNWPDNFCEAAKLLCVSSIKWVPELLKQISPDAPKLSGKDTSWLSDKLTPAWLKLLKRSDLCHAWYIWALQAISNQQNTTSNCLAELLKARNSLAGQ